MKLVETIFFSLAVVFFIIGVHQTFFVGIVESYWLFMLSVAMLLLYKMKRGNTQGNTNQPVIKQPGSKQHKKTPATKVKSRK